MSEIYKTVEDLVGEGKGIWAADASPGTTGKYFKRFGVENSKENRKTWRELVFRSGLEGIGGVILHPETFEMESDSGDSLPSILVDKGIHPIVKVDQSLHPYPSSDSHHITKGIDRLSLDWLSNYYERSARAAKWRAAFPVDDTVTEDGNVEANALLLALYARYCQEAGLVPMVEPEVLYTEGSHGMDECFEVTSYVLKMHFDHLKALNVDLKGMILKTNMVSPAKEVDEATPEEVAEMTVRCFKENVPGEVPGIALLSGGHTPEKATERLEAIVKEAKKAGINVTFSFSRALEMEGMEQWSKDIDSEENIKKAQNVLQDRLSKVLKARMG